MKVSVFIDKTGKNQTINLKSGSTVLDLLKGLKINLVTVIVSRNNELVLENEKLKNNDRVIILSVVSGG